MGRREKPSRTEVVDIVEGDNGIRGCRSSGCPMLFNGPLSKEKTDGRGSIQTKKNRYPLDRHSQTTRGLQERTNK